MTFRQARIKSVFFLCAINKMETVKLDIAVKLDGLLLNFDATLKRLNSIEKEVRNIKNQIITRELEKVKELDYEHFGPDYQDMLDTYEEDIARM